MRALAPFGLPPTMVSAQVLALLSAALLSAAPLSGHTELHAPWERGTNEHTNRMIRRYLPKGTPITDHQACLTAIAEELNEIPRKVLDWLTPREAYERLLATTVASAGCPRTPSTGV